MTRLAYEIGVAEWIRTEVRELDLKLGSVAVAVGATEAAVSRWASGDRQPGIYSYRMLLRYFKQQREQQAAANAKAVQA
jgi:predicted transcriptional regulator